MTTEEKTETQPTHSHSHVAGIARPGKRTKNLVKRLKPEDIAVIDHLDLDRVAAEDLLTSGVKGVVNCSASSSGKYPNMGPLLLVESGVHLIDKAGPELFKRLKDGDPIELIDGDVVCQGEILASGEYQDPIVVKKKTQQRRLEIGKALGEFAQNTVEHMVEESELLSGNLPLPKFKTEFRDRPALVVVRGVDHKADIKALKPYIREMKPALIGVDGGADAILAEGFQPDMIVGDMDSATEKVLRCGAELVVHAYPDGRAPGKEFLDQLGLTYQLVPAAATSQDVAMMIAADKGAQLIVSVGSHFNLVEFLDKGRAGMSSTFLTRLRIGEILIDAKGVSRLYKPRAGIAPIFLLVAAGLTALVAVTFASPGLRDIVELLWLKLQVLLGYNP